MRRKSGNPYSAYQKNNRSGGLRALRVTTEKLITPVMGNRIKILAKIITNWQQVAGDACVYSDPIDIQFAPHQKSDATLILSISAGTGPIIQMMSPQIIDSVNALAGFALVGRIRLVQNMRPHKDRNPQTKPDDAETLCDEMAQHTLENQTQDIQNPRLRAALLKLGQHIHAKTE